MVPSSWRRFVNRALSGARPASRRPRAPRLQCEEFEPRLQMSAFVFSTGLPDGKVATIAEPSNTHNGHVEFESADDFVLNSETKIQRASFTGLLTGGASRADVRNVTVEIYRVFPFDSDVSRTSGPPNFSTDQVPTRVNSPSDVAIADFDSAAGDLRFQSRLLLNSFTAVNSVSSADKIAVATGGNGPATGKEVEFDVTFTTPLDLPAGHYFFVPKVGLRAQAPHAADFLWLSAPKPITAPGTPFTPDLQSWMRFEPGLAPDWLRIGTDIIGGQTFNASFTLSGQVVPLTITGLSQNSVAEGSGDLTLTVNGNNFTNLSTVLVNGAQPLATTFVNAGQLQAVIPAALLAEQGRISLSVADPQNGFSNSRAFFITENVPTLTASVTPGTDFQQVTLSGQVVDQANGDHRVRVRWGDGQVQVLDLGLGTGGPFSVSHTFGSENPHHDTIVVTALDDAGVASPPLTFDVIV
jgi:hypothetical protein